MRWLFEPGFFASHPVHVACLIGTIVAVVSGVVGVFTVMRGQSFAGHSLADVATAGGSGAFLAGITPLFGFVAGGVVGAGAMEAIGVRRARGRDLATGIVLGASIGLAALFLYLSATESSTTGASQQILFGSIFQTVSSTVPIVAIFSVLCLGIMAVRPSSPVAQFREHRHGGRPGRSCPCRRPSLHGGARPRCRPVVARHRGDSLHGPLDRARRHRLAPHEADRLGDGGGCR